MSNIDLTPIELEHLEKYRKLDDKGKKEIDKIIDVYLECKYAKSNNEHI